MNAWAFAGSKLSSRSRTSSTLERTQLSSAALCVIVFLFCLCRETQGQSQSLANQRNPAVLFDSYHAHNFLDRGILPGEYQYHYLNGFHRAVDLLRQRKIEVGELIIGPITPARLKGVQLVVLNLPSVDRPPWLVSEIEAIVNYVRGGGGILFITDHSNCYYHQYHLLPLWERLGLTPTFETVCERQPDCRLSPNGEGWLLVRDFEPHPVTQSIEFFATQTGGRVAGPGIVARTSSQAWADAGATPMYAEGPMGLYGDMKYSASEESGPQGIVLARMFGQGRIVVIADQNAIGDMQISYADNWRLWLNACQWAGGLRYPPAIVNRPSSALLPAPIADERPNFDNIVSQEPDRNAQPRLADGTWQVQCWEPLSQGKFHWGGSDVDQYYYFWSWLNRWTWTSAHEKNSAPNPSGRRLLIAIESDLSDEHLIATQRKVLEESGKVVILSTLDQAVDSQELSAELMQWKDDCCKRMKISADAKFTWHSEPIGHWQGNNGKGSVVLIPNSLALRNANFERPERAPSPASAKWLSRLYRWLFEQA